MSDKDRREAYDRRLSAMRTERSSFMTHWRDLSEYIAPRRGRFELTDRDRGERRHQSIINGVATKALQIATAGIFNGTMSPSRPWLLLSSEDPDLMEYGPAKKWFEVVQGTMRRIFDDSNLYAMAPVMIREELLFGTGCMSHEDDPESLARFYTHTVGSYMVAQSDRLVVDTVAREFEMTVRQVVEWFSPADGSAGRNLSAFVRDAYDRGDYDKWVPVVQFVHPNADFVPGSASPTKRRFASVYYEPGQTNRSTFLSERGMDEFPFYVPRWELTGEDIYGTNCPGMTALGDVKQLQLMERRKAQAIDKMVSPPLQGPPGLRNVPIENLPGGTTIFDPSSTGKGVTPLYDVRLPLDSLTTDMQGVERRIGEAFYTDLFKAISSMEGIQPRNQFELMQRHQERLLELGPVLERQYGDFLDLLVARTFNQMAAANLLPPPPPEIQRTFVKPRYVSMLALAQQSVITGNIDRLVAFTAGLAGSGFADVLDKFDADQAVDEYAGMVGAPLHLVVPDDQVAEARANRQRMQSMQAMAQMAKDAGPAVAAMGEIPLGEDNVAGRMASVMAGGRR